MKTLETLEKICNDFINMKIDIKEFQSRLHTLAIEDELRIDLETIIFDADNILEEIIFCSLESNYYVQGVEVANSLLEKVDSKRVP